ncbi:amidohydrolase family protein [Kitasatospora sp. CM 4170]|uniref:Amidohydrolase family protein n=1 Tax=Kitasatospora aburaviensis TaxID=67265 RepID=A0ABW1EUN3_9ACTN|nr:amidohydrolase family protein [Kitasatospora sp. CM 4170]WNM43640.1 amidohydrolase family protein [Kitasatospora sp. CM 4170]
MDVDHPGAGLLVTNVRVFDGIGDEAVPGHVRVERDRIAEVVLGAPPPRSARGTTVLDGGGGTLMPGLTDAHVHLFAVGGTMADLQLAPTGTVYYQALASARDMLMRGFTTVRDMAGDTEPLRRVLDRGLFPGPRIYPSQAAVSQTSGHGDFGAVHDTPTAFGGPQARTEQIGFTRVADGPERVLAAVREQLRKGAAQIKLMAGGGVVSEFDPLDVLQFTTAELEAAVAAAADWGTYVTAHVYTSEGVRRAVDAGVRCIEHGHLVDEDTVRHLAERGVWLSTQPFEVDDHHYASPDSAHKNREVCEGVARTFGWALRHGVRLAFGTDLVFDPTQADRQIRMLVRLGKYLSPVETLKLATSGNAELFRLSGRRDPYRAAPLGVVTPGAWADLLVVDGDPTTDLSVLAEPERNLRLIVKGGVVHKNDLD